MLASSQQKQIMVGITLAVLMGITRGRHFATVEHLPGASWAVLFLAGVYLRPLWVFPALLAWAASLDFAAVTWAGVSSFCISPAYGFYGALWGAGRWYAQHHRNTMATLLPLTVSLFAGSAVSEFVSSGSFYFLSGRFEQTQWTELAQRLLEYYPRSLSSLLFYVGGAGIIYLLSIVVSVPQTHSTQVGFPR
ncbi:MAG: hypothetical protein HY348_02300 [Nitrospira defluvii]|nr:hypothetical protein [Nitrospira defluvii]